MESSLLVNYEKSNQIRPKIEFGKLKSDYFLQLLFCNLEKKKLLEIIKYSKNIKKRINININDYKEYSEKYSSIEIEIKPNHDGTFIKFSEEDGIYYHIYFNNVKEEIKRDYFTYDEKIKIIKIIIDYQVDSFKDLFDNCYCIKSIYFKKFYRNNIINMRNMFFNCSSLKELNLNNFNTNNVTNMSKMFYECSSLKELNLNNFNTHNVTDMFLMFHGCSNELLMKIKSQYKNIKIEEF